MRATFYGRFISEFAYKIVEGSVTSCNNWFSNFLEFFGLENATSIGLDALSLSEPFDISCFWLKISQMTF